MSDRRPQRGETLQGNYAGAVSRLLAWGADLVIANTSFVVTLAVIAFGIDTVTPWTVNFNKENQIVIVAGLLWFAIYLMASWVVFARTPGMTLLGLRIVRSDGSPLDRRHALIRLVAFPLGFLTLGLGFLGIIVGRAHQAIYDRIARTTVVYDWDAEAARLRQLATGSARRRVADKDGREAVQPPAPIGVPSGPSDG